MRTTVWTIAVAAAACAVAPRAADAPKDAPKDEVQKVAETYLNSLTGKGSVEGRELLLGGATMNAQLFNLENWRIISRERRKAEEGDLAKAIALMKDYDEAGRSALTELIAITNSDGNLAVQVVSEKDASKLLGPTREKANAFLKGAPVLALVARANREVYWHPQNPMRALLKSTSGTGRYSVEYHELKIETKEGPRQVPRQWPLRVVRFKAGKLDTGWKVLPASDWNAE